MSKVKICGLTTKEEISFVNETLPDYIGFVFAPSRRQIDEEQARILKNLLAKEILSVGVFVNNELTMVERLCREGIIDLVQLHGDEDEEYISLLRALVKQPIIKARRVRGEVKEDLSSADFLLFDTYDEGEYGGTGKSFSWDLVKEYKKPFFLAGGLNIGNIEQALRETKPYCVDVSSGVELDGKKDKGKIKKIIELVRSVENDE